VSHRRTVEELLYAAIVELEYVQCVENCSSGLCASSNGRKIIEEGMALLGVKDLSAESLPCLPKSHPCHGSGRFKLGQPKPPPKQEAKTT